MGCGGSIPTKNNEKTVETADSTNSKITDRPSSLGKPGGPVEFPNNTNKVVIVNPHVSLQKHQDDTVPSKSGKDQATAKSTKEESTLPNQKEKSNNRSIYKALTVGTVLIVRDCFTSKYSGKVMYKWRETEIMDVDPVNPRRIFIHFVGWNPSFDAWLDVEEEIHKLAPVGMLSKPEMDAGVALDQNQMQIVKYYLLTGSYSSGDSSNDHQPLSSTTSMASTQFPISPAPNRNSSMSINSTGTPSAVANRYYSLEKTFSSEALIPPPSYEVGQQVDILDIFYRPGSDTPSSKWRKAKIIEKKDTKIRISYIGWDSKFDETLDIYENASRISAFGTKSNEQASILNAAQKTPENRRSLSLYNSSNSTGPNTNANPNGKFTFSFISENAATPVHDHSRRKNGGEIDEEANEVEEEGEDDEEEEEQEEEEEEVSPSRKSGAFSKSFHKLSKIMSKAMNKLNPNGKSDNNNKSKKDLKDGNNTTNNGENSTANNSEQSGHHHTNGGEVSNNPHYSHEPTAEEIAAFEAEINKERVFIQTLQANGMHVIEIEGDGNCLFRALSHQLYLNEEYHEQLRYFCVEHLKKHQKRFEKFMCDVKFEDYCEEMAKKGTWADDIEIRVMEEILDRNIHIYSSNSTNPKDYLIPVNENPEEEKLMQGVIPINLSYHGQSHYNSIYYDRTPLPIPLRTTKILLNSRIALSEGKSIPMPISSPNTTAVKRPSIPGAPVSPAPSSSSSQQQQHTFTPSFSVNGNSNNNSARSPVLPSSIVSQQMNYMNSIQQQQQLQGKEMSNNSSPGNTERGGYREMGSSNGSPGDYLSRRQENYSQNNNRRPSFETQKQSLPHPPAPMNSSPSASPPSKKDLYIAAISGNNSGSPNRPPISSKDPIAPANPFNGSRGSSTMYGSYKLNPVPVINNTEAVVDNTSPNISVNYSAVYNDNALPPNPSKVPVPMNNPARINSNNLGSSSAGNGLKNNYQTGSNGANGNSQRSYNQPMNGLSSQSSSSRMIHP